MVTAWAFHDWFGSKCSPQIKSHIIKTMVNKVSNYPYQFFQDRLSGEIMAKISDAAHRTPQIIDTLVIEMFQLFITILISIVLLATVSIWFGLAMLIWVSLFISVL